MRIDGKCFGEVEANVYEVPDHHREVRLSGDQIQVLVYDGTAGRWVPASSLKSKQETYKDMVMTLGWKLSSFADKAGMTKAEVKRKLVSMGVISR